MENWEKVRESVVYKGYRNMIKKDFRLPDGKVAAFDIVGNNPFVAVAALNTKQEFILVRQFRPGPELILTSFTEGFIDKGEQPEEAGIRELLEETGYHAEKMIYLNAIRSAYSTEICHCLLATDCIKIGDQSLDDDEFLEPFTVHLRDFRTFIRDPNNHFTNIDCGYLALDYLNLLGPDQV